VLALGIVTLSGKKKLSAGALSRCCDAPLPSGDDSLRHTSGFWMRDEQLLSSGKPYGLATIILRDGKPFPVTGTTYMISDVAWKFLLERIRFSGIKTLRR